jgi:hypothetical protein
VRKRTPKAKRSFAPSRRTAFFASYACIKIINHPKIENRAEKCPVFSNEKRLFAVANSRSFSLFTPERAQRLRAFRFLQASGANVAADFLSVFHVVHFLNVRFESSSRLAVGVAYVVARSLTFSTNIAYSRHIDTSK